MTKKKSKLSDASIVPANGRPTEVKVGYRTIKIKYVNPNFIISGYKICDSCKLSKMIFPV